MRIHLSFAFYVVCAGLVTDIGRAQWAAVLACAGLVMAAECFNTAVERLCDSLCPERNEGIKLAKDAAAAAVLAAAIASAAVGIIVFFSREQLDNFRLFLTEKPLLAGLLALTLVPAVFFVIGNREKN